MSIVSYQNDIENDGKMDFGVADAIVEEMYGIPVGTEYHREVIREGRCIRCDDRITTGRVYFKDGTSRPYRTNCCCK